MAPEREDRHAHPDPDHGEPVATDSFPASAGNPQDVDSQPRAGDLEDRGVELGPLIAEGRTAEIYAWRPGQVIKLYRDWVPADLAEYEARIARLAQATGAPMPAVGALIRVNGRLGLVYERVDGRQLIETMRRKPWTLGEAARCFAGLHAQMHRLPAPGLPRQRERLQAKIRSAQPLPDELKASLLGLLEFLPEGDRLCHGDFHPLNVLITHRGPVIIDWIDASSGDPLADVARSVILFSEAFTPRGRLRDWFERWGRHFFLQSYLRRYFQLAPGDAISLKRWLPVVAAARLSEGVVEAEGSLLEMARRLP